MRFNAKELAFIAQQPSQEFDKEGILYMKERKDGLFKKGEAFVPRLFRLRGNLLFYLKGKEKSTEAVGVFVLERCMVQLDAEDELPYTFLLVFEKDEKTVQLAAGSEEERDSWIERLHIAGYECMQMQMHSLREQLAARTGRDPIEDPEPSALPEFKSGTMFGTEEPFFEMCVSCTGLSKEVNGLEPDTFASVHLMTPPHMQWVPHAHTEIFEKSCNPTYLTTVGFSACDCVEKSTRIKLVIYDVKERMTNTMTQIGCCVFTLNDLFTAPNTRLKFKLNALVHGDVGNVIVMGWTNQLKLDASPDPAPSKLADRKSLSAHFERLHGCKTRRLDQLKQLYANVITKTFRFPTNGGQQLSVHEYMGESKMTFALPRQLLQLWIEEEKEYTASLQDLGQLYGADSVACRELQDNSMAACSMYTQHADYLSDYRGPPFKKSIEKSNKELEFAPTNLHLQRIWVHNDITQHSACYDVTTVGCFTAFAQKFKQGGLRRMLRQLSENIMASQSQISPEGENILEVINGVLNDISRLRAKVADFCETVCCCAVQGKGEELSKAITSLSEKMRQLLSVCQHPHIEHGYTAYNKATENHQNYSNEFLTPPVHSSQQNGEEVGSPETSWKWSGTDFVRSPTQEPFELTRLNTEAALVCALSKVEEFMSGETEVTRWLDELSPLIIRLKLCVEVMCTRARSSLSFLTLHVCGPHVALLHSIKYRRDVVFSQAITAAVSAFVTRLRSSVTDEQFLQQLVRVGFLVEFESLLSCFGDEMGMLEDMAVGVADLSHVTFKMKAVDNVDAVMPQIEGSRPGYVVHIPVLRSMFGLLPNEMQRGQPIRMIPVLFSIGINEQTSLAEKFGDLSTQYEINHENCQKLYEYYRNYTERMEESESAGKHDLPLDTLMRKLSMNVDTKKNKNVEVLHLAAEICRRLKGVRFTSCKSAKDRTAMGVTLEQVQVLQKQHDLAAHVFTHTLECMRSEGVRRENTVKNTGIRKYAFNSIQLVSFPKLYRPPHGTFGNVQS